MKKSLRLAALVTFAALALGIGTSFAEEAAPAAPKKDVGWKEGQFLADLKLKKYGGGEFDTKTEFGKRSMVFVIVSPTCSLCRQEVSEFAALADQVKTKADLFVVVAANEGAAKRFVDSGDVKFPVLLDDEYALMTAANFRVNPSTVVVDKSGKIVKRLSQYSGGQAEALVKELQ